ncbi:hypothetical protein DFQ28_000778 [Apophysomyces sp. BC1034]|nr:hypothetical protein DFQ30_000152 [Apophysomyces sp. BC1015]KAG0181366.1 hypothetical protein DFQ29_008504 [Apophysomyces sp. BC1021]KAG0191175.1 hypothetical protein DFQ28_000778 [Apophysomyces sp. BC1034]
MATWSEESRALHDAICQARVSNSSTTADTLQHQLQLNKQKILNLIDDAPKNAQHRASLRGGKAYINCTTRNVNNEFANEVLFLSDQLDIDEHIAATLLLHGMEQSSRVNSNTIDTAILTYHKERGYLLACIDTILKTAKDASVSENIRFVCREFMAEIMQERVYLGSRDSTPTGSFPSKILQSIKKLEAIIKTISSTGSLETTQPPIAHSTTERGKLGEEITAMRIKLLKDERISLAQILYHLSSLFWVGSDDLIAMTENLETSDLTDITLPYLLLAVAAAISPANHVREITGQGLAFNERFFKTYHERITQTLWKVPAVKSVVVMQWTLFIVCAAHLNHALAETLPLKEEDIEKLIFGAISADVFPFMNHYLLYFQQENASIDSDRGLLKSSVTDGNRMATEELKIDPSDYTKFNADIREEFQTFFIYELEQMAVAFVENMSSVLRSLKYREEDTNVPIQTPSSTKNAIISSSDSPDRCRDLEAFLLLLASIFRNRLNAGTKFWTREDSGLFTFVKWTTDIKVAGTVIACYDFLGSIAAGDICAQHAFNFLEHGTLRTDLSASNLISWGKPMAALQFYIPILREKDSKAVIPEVEEELLRKFFYLMTQVVQYSLDARTSLWSDAVLRVRDGVAEALISRTSINFRAMMYDLLAAFCSPWGGGVQDVGRKISLETWDFLENSNFFISKKEESQAAESEQKDVTTKCLLRPPVGFLQDLDMEKASKVYAVTHSVVNLLSSMIHVPSKRDELVSGFRPTGPSVRPMLGRETRTPGVAPYISLVIDSVFLALDSQRYLYAGSKWQLADACLKVMENSVRSFDLTHLQDMVAYTKKHPVPKYSNAMQGLNDASSGNTTPGLLEEALLVYIMHPGFEVIKRILSGTRVVTEMCKIIEGGLSETGNRKIPYYTQCVTRCLRILHRTFEIQDAFCNVLAAKIKERTTKNASTEIDLGNFTFPPLPPLTPLSQILLYRTNAIVQVAQLVNCEDQEEICFLSTKILHALSKEPRPDKVTKNIASAGGYTVVTGFGGKVAAVLAACKDALPIIYNFSERLEIDHPETTTYDDYEYDINNIPFWRAEKTLNDTYSVNTDFQPQMTSSVRLAILDMLLESTDLEKASPSLAEFLLGYTDLRSGVTGRVGDLRSGAATATCLLSILDLLRQGIGNDEDKMDDDDKPLPLIATHPIFAEKCYQLIYRLCANEEVSNATMRYLRSTENFFYNQFKAMSARLEQSTVYDTSVLPGVMVCADGTRMKTDFFALLSQLHQRAWLLESVALELHTTASMGRNSDLIRLLGLLYGYEETRNEENIDFMDTEHEDTNIFSLTTSNFEQSLVKILEIVSSLEFRWVDELEEDSTDIDPSHFVNFDPRSFEIENERGCLVYDIRSIYKLFREEQRQREVNKTIVTEDDWFAFEDEMGRILQKLMEENHSREISHGKFHCLRAWKQVVQVTLSQCFDLFPFEARERIIYGLLSMLLPKLRKSECVDNHILEGLSEVILRLLTRLQEDKLRQGILRIAPVSDAQFATSRLPNEKLRLICRGLLDCIQEDGMTAAVRGDMYTALVTFLQYVGGERSECIGSNLKSDIIDLIVSDEKILDMLCNDASDGQGLWKSTAYIALDALYTSASEKSSATILSFLTKKNFLRYSIDMIRREDSAFLNILEQESGSLHSLYIYEAKMSLFLRITMRKEGARLLLENRILDVLTHCQFMNARPETESLSLGINPCQLYEQMLVPAFKLIVGLLCSVGRVDTIMLEKLESWTKKQQQALIYILRDEQQPATLSSLTQLKLVTSILYHMSCRPGFFEDLVSRSLNHLHTAMLHLNAKYLALESLSPDNVMPATDDEKILSRECVSAGGRLSTALAIKADDLIISIQKNVIAYARNATFMCDERGNNLFRPVFSHNMTSVKDRNAAFIL